MDTHRYKIKRPFVIPFVLAVFLLVILLFMSLLHRRSAAETVVLTIFLCAALPVLGEMFYSLVTTNASGLTIRKFLRTRAIPWENINQVGLVMVRRKTYLLLTTRRGFYILSSAYGDFPRLVRDITDQVPFDRVDAEVRQQLEEGPLVNRGDVLSIWLAVILMIGLIVMKLFGVI